MIRDLLGTAHRTTTYNIRWARRYSSRFMFVFRFVGFKTIVLAIQDVTEQKSTTYGINQSSYFQVVTKYMFLILTSEFKGKIEFLFSPQDQLIERWKLDRVYHNYVDEDACSTAMSVFSSHSGRGKTINTMEMASFHRTFAGQYSSRYPAFVTVSEQYKRHHRLLTTLWREENNLCSHRSVPLKCVDSVS